MIIIQWALLSQIRESFGITQAWFQNSVNLEAYVLLRISLPVWIYFIFMDSNKSRGTFGKRLVRMSVLDLHNQSIHLSKSFQRTFLVLLPWEISHAGIIFPSLIYFEEEPNIRILTIIGMTLFIAYMLSILLNRSGRTLYDIWLGIKVIRNDIR